MEVKSSFKPSEALINDFESSAVTFFDKISQDQVENS